MTAAQQAQNLNRDSGGRYATKIHSEVDNFTPPAVPGVELLSDDEYDVRFGHVPNPNDGDQFYWEREHIQAALDAGTITEAQVWTAMDADDGGIVGTNGIHRVNAFAYFVSEQPAPDDVVIEARLQGGDPTDDGGLSDDEDTIWGYVAEHNDIDNPDDFPELAVWNVGRARAESVYEYMDTAASVLEGVNEVVGDGYNVDMSWYADSLEFNLVAGGPDRYVVGPKMFIPDHLIDSNDDSGSDRFRTAVAGLTAAREKFVAYVAAQNQPTV